MFLLKKVIVKNNNELDNIEWIRINVYSERSLINLLKNAIGIHDGALQKHITPTTIEYFNSQKLKYLFYTTIIIEGVILVLKISSILILKRKSKPIDYFDYSNVKGRAGCLMVHYIGRICNFNPIPENKQVIIDIPFFEKTPVSDEVLFNLEINEVKEINREQSQKIENLPQNEKELIKQIGVNVFGQKKYY
jgi:hypothetical protein